jgi:hypothetical protein
MIIDLLKFSGIIPVHKIELKNDLRMYSNLSDIPILIILLLIPSYPTAFEYLISEIRGRKMKLDQKLKELGI